MMRKYRVVKPTLDRFCKPLKVGDIIELDVEKVGSNLEEVIDVTEDEILRATAPKNK